MLQTITTKKVNINMNLNDCSLLNINCNLRISYNNLRNRFKRVYLLGPWSFQSKRSEAKSVILEVLNSSLQFESENVESFTYSCDIGRFLLRFITQFFENCLGILKKIENPYSCVVLNNTSKTI